MKISSITLVIVLLLIIAAAILAAATYTLKETEQAVVTQFGRPIGDPITEAGLHFKKPFIQKVHLFEKRILAWDGYPNEIPTKDKLYIHVDTYARWRIADPLLYFKRLRTERDAQSRLDDILDGETRNAIANYELVEIVRTSNRDPEVDEELADIVDQLSQLAPIEVGRSAIAERIYETASTRLTDLGIELLDIRFKRINYNDVVQQDIYRRMQSERKQIAEKFRSEGQGEAARIRGQKERMLREIESEAYRTIQQIRGGADAKATAIYAKAYNQSPASVDFYRFLKRIETWRTALDPKTMALLSTDSDLFKMIKSMDAAEFAEPEMTGEPIDPDQFEVPVREEAAPIVEPGELAPQVIETDEGAAEDVRDAGMAGQTTTPTLPAE